MGEEASKFNRELAEQSFDGTKYALIVLGVGRLFLMLISIKKLEVCKVYFYYMMVYKMIECILPRDYGSVQAKLYMAYDLIDFCMLYFQFWPSLLTIAIC